MKISNLVIPEVINNFEVYDLNGEKFIGITEEVSLAELNQKTATVQGAGIYGSYDTPVIGQFDSIAQDVPFRMLNRSPYTLINPTRRTGIELRGAIQMIDRGTGVTGMAGLRYLLMGKTKNIKPGTVSVGGVMNASITIESTYVEIIVDGMTIIKLDKLNGIYIVNGEDIAAAIRKLC